MQPQESFAKEMARFRASAGSSQGLGETPSAALNDLLEHLSDAVHTPIVIWPYNLGDVHFTQNQQERLNELKTRRDTLTAGEQQEWERLVEASFNATVARTQSVQSSKA